MLRTLDHLLLITSASQDGRIRNDAANASKANQQADGRVAGR